MTWSAARGALREALAETGYTVFNVPPQNLDTRAPVIVLAPPARTVDRMPSSVRRTRYQQPIRVIGLASSEGEPSLEGVGDAVDDAVEAVNDVLDRHIKLGGAAVSVTPATWEALTVQDYPAGSGIPHAIMAGQVEIIVDVVNEYGV